MYIYIGSQHAPIQSYVGALSYAGYPSRMVESHPITYGDGLLQ